MKNFKLFFIAFLFVFFSLSAFGQAYKYLNDGVPQKLAITEAKLGGNSFLLMLARSDLEKAKGLMFRRYLPPNHGMIFVYENEQFMSYWMKNTMISLDLVLISEDLIVIEYILDMKAGFGYPDSELEHYRSRKKAKYAIELNAGTVNSLNIKVGDKLEISPLCLYCK